MKITLAGAAVARCGRRWSGRTRSSRYQRRAARASGPGFFHV